MKPKYLLPSLLLSFALTPLMTKAEPIENIGHIHNLTFAGENQQTLILGAHIGLFSYEQNSAKQISKESFDVMGLSREPVSGALYASGHPAKGGNLGLLRSDDEGKTFRSISKGINGPVDFHQLAVSSVDPKIVYGVHDGLQVSADGGINWKEGGKLPPKLLQLAASDIKPNKLFAASEQGLFVSDNNGDSWQRILSYPTTSVLVNKGSIFAFVVGKGLVVAEEAEEMQWREINNTFGSQVLLDFAITADGHRLVGLSQYGALLESVDQGRNWQSLPAKPLPVTVQEKNGQIIFQTNCQSCHGIAGVGETYSTEGLTTKGYIFAPALNGSAHAWHHTDDQLLKTIMEGSPRTSKMPAWKATLSKDDALDAIAYLKSLWGETQKRCQGPKHMDRACIGGK
ncbi:c-type cytochrome [Motiliproteus sp. MSK22-1]|uniref:c-type cytochrome n=1 Tax=Motiliproteus sp. MSK22-1 TaxID=1897630 RepID=UPI00097A6AC2|nr:c-type cytochrome [Motiliproteus sp. MSK22-1]OMH31795.1 hypothetical protein BGP75_16915 [Motiliproteus sp. MSK22-1]